MINLLLQELIKTKHKCDSAILHKKDNEARQAIDILDIINVCIKMVYWSGSGAKCQMKLLHKFQEILLFL